jgi:hypothetical protein
VLDRGPEKSLPIFSNQEIAKRDVKDSWNLAGREIHLLTNNVWILSTKEIVILPIYTQFVNEFLVEMHRRNQGVFQSPPDSSQGLQVRRTEKFKKNFL